MSDRNIPTDERSQWVQPGNWAEQYGGLTKRELFAAMAMQAILTGAVARGCPSTEWFDQRAAVDVADALLSALDQTHA